MEEAKGLIVGKDWFEGHNWREWTDDLRDKDLYYHATILIQAAAAKLDYPGAKYVLGTEHLCLPAKYKHYGLSCMYAACFTSNTLRRQPELAISAAKSFARHWAVVKYLDSHPNARAKWGLPGFMYYDILTMAEKEYEDNRKDNVNE